MSLEAERFVIGMSVRRQEYLERSLAVGLSPEHFWDPDNRRYFQAIVEVSQETGRVDRALLTAKLGKESRAVFADLLANSPIEQNVEFYAEEVKNTHWQRQTLELIKDAQRQFSDREEYDKIEPLQEAILRLNSVVNVNTHSIRTFSAEAAARASEAAIRERAELFTREKKTPGIPTGFTLLDKHIHGWRKGTLNTIGARTSVGKTTLAVNFALHAAINGRRVAFFTVEMSAVEIADKMISRLGEIKFSAITNGDLDPDEVEAVQDSAASLARLPITISELLDTEFERFLFEVRRRCRTEKVDLVILDYVQLLYAKSMKGVPRHEELKRMTATMKALARTIETPFIVLAQLNRKATDECEPRIEHFQGSDSIGQDADVSILLWKEDGMEGRHWMTVAKARGGKKCKFPIKADLAKNLFGNASINEAAYD